MTPEERAKARAWADSTVGYRVVGRLHLDKALDALDAADARIAELEDAKRIKNEQIDVMETALREIKDRYEMRPDFKGMTFYEGHPYVVACRALREAA